MDRHGRLNAAETLHLLSRVAARDPQHVDTHGTYTHDGRPGCLIGHVLAEPEVGLTVEQLDQLGNSTPLHITTATNLILAGHDVARAMNIAGMWRTRFTPEARRVLDAAQDAQDCDMPWYAAVEAAAEQCGMVSA